KAQKVKKVWQRISPSTSTKDKEKCQVSLTALNTLHSDTWYFDSGCSRHMCGNLYAFFTLIKDNGGIVTFGDGSSKHVKGKRIVKIPGLPPLGDVRYVKGLRANLISISQLCNSNHKVLFEKGKCIVLDEQGKCVVEGIRTIENCYGVKPSSEQVCLFTCLNEVDLWHQ
ncbi:hypothetical protein, partial [Bartonella sp. AC130YNZD]|uniref:hypothetical protein n=1 Tax=Bartonella sp. AC130YNZD TaxID=3243445 RepID=UPI0035D047BD